MDGHLTMRRISSAAYGLGTGGDGLRNEQMWRGEGWCEQVTEFLMGMHFVDREGRAGTGPSGGREATGGTLELQSIVIV